MAYSPFPRLDMGEVPVHSFAPAIASLGDLIDALDKDRANRARIDQELAMKAQDRQIAMGREQRLDEQNQRQFRTGIMEKNAQRRKELQEQFARGGAAEPLLFVDEQGAGSYIKPEPIAPPAPVIQPPAVEPNDIPAPTAQGPEDIGSLTASPTSQTTAVPPGQARGAFHRMPVDPTSSLATVENLTESQFRPEPKAPAPERFRYNIPGQEPLELDREKARNDLRARREFEAEGIRQQLQNPNLTPEQKLALDNRLMSVMAGIPPKIEAAVMSEAGRNQRQGQKLDADKEKWQAHEAGLMARFEAKQKKAQGKLSSLENNPRSSYGALFARKPSQATTVANGVYRQINALLKNENWDKLVGVGTQRLDMAMRTIETGGAGEFEALINFFGYIRGGVPAQNETTEWHKMTDTAVTMLDKFGQKIGLGSIGTLYSKRDLTETEREQLRQKYSGIPPQQKAEVIEAIRAAKKGLRDFAADDIRSVARAFRGRAPAEKEIAQARLDAMADFAGLPEKNWLGVTMPKLQGESEAAPTQQAPTGPAPGKMSDEEMLKALKGM